MSRSVFLSYASEDRDQARSIGDALTNLGLEVWLDESALGGGDAWDRKIRKQIRECDYFMPIVSARTEARPEGYFRREWRLAVERTLDMADDHPFLLPVVIDETDQADARVPERFLTVQWLSVPGGRPTAALEALCHRIVSGDAVEAPVVKPAAKPAARNSGGSPKGPAFKYPDFPHEVPGQRTRFWFQVLGWALRSAWLSFKRLPRWLRIIIYLWLGGTLLSHGCASARRDSADISPANVARLKTIADEYQGSTNKADVAKLGLQIAREFSDNAADGTGSSLMLAIPFTAPAGDPAAAKLADAAFAQTYGRIAISRRDQVTLSQEPIPSLDMRTALQRGRSNHVTFVLYGAIEPLASTQVLTVTIARVANGAVVWSKSYAASGADPVKIAAQVDSNVPAADEN